MWSPIKLISVCFVFILLLVFFWLPSTFCAPKPEVNNGNMTGILSIGPDGNIYIQFTKGHVKFTKSTVGNLIMGEIPEELTVEQADQHGLQKAAYMAYNAWLKCKTAKKKLADGKITAVQMEYDCARYRLYSAEEGLSDAIAINNNLGINWATPYYEISKLDSENAKKDVQNALNNGAVPTPEGYQPPGAAAGFTPPFNISDPSIDTNNLILDNVPMSRSNPNQL